MRPFTCALAPACCSSGARASRQRAPCLGGIGHSTDRTSISLWVCSVHSSARAIMENGLGKMHTPWSLRPQQIPHRPSCVDTSSRPASSAWIEDPLCFLYVPMTLSCPPSPLVVHGPGHKPKLFDACVSEPTSCHRRHHTDPALRGHGLLPLSPCHPWSCLLVLRAGPGLLGRASHASCGRAVPRPALPCGTWRPRRAQSLLFLLQVHRI